jgi:HSP20 family molecular chaperone IbpA
MYWLTDYVLRDYLDPMNFGSIADWFGNYKIHYEVSNEGDKAIIRLYVPGFSREQLVVKVVNRKINVSGKSKEPYKSFDWSMSVGTNWNHREVSAELIDGILYISVPRKETEQTEEKIVHISCRG